MSHSVAFHDLGKSCSCPTVIHAKLHVSINFYLFFLLAGRLFGLIQNLMRVLCDSFIKWIQVI